MHFCVAGKVRVGALSDESFRSRRVRQGGVRQGGKARESPLSRAPHDEKTRRTRGHRRSLHFAILLVASFASRVVCHSTTAVGSTVEEEVLEVLERAAKWQLANVPPMRHWTEWPLAVFLVGLSALSTSARGSSPIWRKQLLDIASIKNKWQLGARTYHADDQVVAQVYLELYACSDDEYRDKVMIRAIHERFDSILKHPPKSANLTFVGRSKTDNWAWSDSLFMAPPAWIQLWSLTHNEVYRSHAITEFWRTTNFLFDADERLYYRDSNYFPPRKDENILVTRQWLGAGWACANVGTATGKRRGPSSFGKALCCPRRKNQRAAKRRQRRLECEFARTRLVLPRV